MLMYTAVPNKQGTKQEKKEKKNNSYLVRPQHVAH
jgi:hypothetical protein